MAAYGHRDAVEENKVETNVWDAETIGGTFTRNILKKALTPHMPINQEDMADDEDETAEVQESNEDAQEVLETEIAHTSFRQERTAASEKTAVAKPKPRKMQVYCC